MCNMRFSHKLWIACSLIVLLAYNWKIIQCAEIECVPIKSCPTVLKLIITTKFAPETYEFLKQSHCGFDRDQPKVWCSKLDFCVTPQDKNGTCTLAEKCKPFLQLRDSLNTFDPQVRDFLSKFRCNEILPEEHVCCEDESSQNGNLQRSNFNGKPAAYSRGDDDYSDYGDYEWPKELFKHDYYGSLKTTYRPDYSNINNRWNVPLPVPELSYINHRDFLPNYEYNDNNPNTFQGFHDFHNRDDSNEVSNNNKRGTSREEYHINHERDSEDNWNYFEFSTQKRARNERTTSTGSSAERAFDHDYDHSNKNYERTTIGSRNTERTRNNSNRNVKGSATTQKPNSKTNRDTTTRITTPSTRRTTSNYDSTSTKRIYVNEGDIIFEDTFDALTRGKSSTTTEKSRRPSSRRTQQDSSVKKYCETPDKKSGICTRSNNCQHYTNLQNNLDKSKKAVRDYLDKFKCSSNNEICCETDEENVIDNSVISAERSSENVLESISNICGRLTASIDRITGGRIANLGEFPWLALLQYPSNKGIQQGCGGSLINSRYVVTAAHCVDEQILRGKRLGQVRQVVLGEYDTRNKTDCIYTAIGQDCADPAKTYKVASITSHNLYSSNTTRHDIALLRLDREVTFTDYIKPICLPAKAATLRGNESFIIAGWGRTDTDMFSPILRKAKIPLVGKEDCNRNQRSLINGQICAGKGNGTDSCNGDSGGPLMLQVNQNFESVIYATGVISYGFGNKCGMGPSVNTFVPFYIDWINQNIKP